MECNCSGSTDDAVHGSWLPGSSVQMGAFTVVGYLLYRFSQTLPRLIRWPIRLFCYLTGLSSLWSWVSRLAGTLRGPSRDQLAETSVGVDGKLAPSSDFSDPNREPALRLILLGPSGGGRTSLADTLSGCRAAQIGEPAGPLMESAKRRTAVDGREVTVINTPDLLGSSLGDGKRAREALRSLQLASPGPHAFLLVIPVPGSGTGVDQDAARAIRTTLELFGDEVAGHVIPVLTHADRLGPRQTLDQLLAADAGGLMTALSLCGQRAELADNGPDSPPEARRAMLRRLVGRAAETRALMRGHFVHELQRREDRVREEQLADMASVLARKLGRM
ncbi:GTPase IMAP family member 4-like [Diretmus argenteus]